MDESGTAFLAVATAANQRVAVSAPLSPLVYDFSGVGVVLFRPRCVRLALTVRA